jgi:hypothetical protein
MQICLHRKIKSMADFHAGEYWHNFGNHHCALPNQFSLIQSWPWGRTERLLSPGKNRLLIRALCIIAFRSVSSALISGEIPDGCTRQGALPLLKNDC